MAISSSFLEAHIRAWEDRLHSPYYPHRKKWPSRLFHHSPLENAIQILKDGFFRSRSDPKNQQVRDIAAASVIHTRLDAHDFVRMYFRPRTPTQYHIEGIRKTGECKYGELAHAPVLIMFVINARQILTRSGVAFCDRNMQVAGAEQGTTEDYFSQIPFEKVFHEGALGGDYSITQHRCAEVLFPSPLPLDGVLQWIYCRSDAEKATLLHQLGRASVAWENKVLVSEDLRVFQREYVFVEDVGISQKGVTFQLNPRWDREKVSIRMKVWSQEGKEVVSFFNPSMAAVPESPHKGWLLESALKDGQYKVRIEIEEHLAYENSLVIGADLF